MRGGKIEQMTDDELLADFDQVREWLAADVDRNRHAYAAKRGQGAALVAELDRRGLPWP